MLKTFRNVVVAALAVLAPATGLAQAPQAPLSEVRDLIVFPELTAQEKRIISEQAQLLLRDLYVHRFEKQSFYPGVLDPVPAIADVVDNIDNISVTEMEETIYRIFTSQRDLHLNYILPAPYAFWDSFLPVTFRRTKTGRDEFEARIVATSQTLFEQYAPDQRIPEIGDKVIRYGGRKFAEAVALQQETSQGANEFGGFVRAIDEMTFITHFLHLVPPTDSVEITLKPVNGGAPYTIVLPWITEYFGPPLDTAPTNVSALSARGLSRSESPVFNSPSDLKRALSSGEDLYIKAREQFLASHPELRPQSVYPDNPSQEPTITWGIIENDNGRFGYMRIASMSPVFGSDFGLQEVRRLLIEEFEDTQGLIVDVRNNGGGSIVYADSLTQLFGVKRAQTIEARLLNTDLNRRIFNESILGDFDPEFRDSINEAAGSGDTYAATVPFTTEEQANAIGQAYDRPVGILTNGRSYSAADLFPCAMKDSFQALIFGQDGRTGAGGANVVEHSLFNFLLRDTFTALPAGHRMRVSWRQSVRFNKEQTLVEDFGCEADIDVDRTVQDLLTDDAVQANKVTRRLARLNRTERYRPNVRVFETPERVNLTSDSYRLAVRHTRKVNVIVDGVEIGAVPVNARRQEKIVDIALPALETGSLVNVLFEGQDLGGDVVWTLKKQFLRLPDPVVVDDSGLLVDFSTATDIAPFVVINNSPPANGWNLVPPYLQIGYNPTYVENTDSDAFAVLDLAVANPVLEFDLEYITESFFDFIEVFVTDEAGNNSTLLFDSGAVPLQTYQFSLAPFAGQTIQLHYRFTSDVIINDVGVRLGRVQISNAP